MNKETRNFLAKLIECRSVHSQGAQIKLALKIIKDEFSGDFMVRELRAAGQPILLLSNVKGNNFDFILAGHIDVVSAQDRDFVLKAKGDRLYGRGTRDMKGPLVTGIYAIRDWLKVDRRQARIGIIVSADEETGGASMKTLLSGRRYRAKFAFLPDGGDENQIIIGQKGFLQLKVTVRGQSAHASTPHEGDNPIEKAMVLYQHLHKKFPAPRHQADWRTSVALTKIESGDCLNQVPDRATAWFDIRYVQAGHRGQIIAEIKKYLGKKGQCAVVAENGAFIIEPKNIYLHKLAAAIKQVTGRPAKLVREAGTSDAVFFTENGIPAALFWPRGGGVHQVGEWVGQKSLERFYQIIYSFLDNF